MDLPPKFSNQLYHRDDIQTQFLMSIFRIRIDRAIDLGERICDASIETLKSSRVKVHDARGYVMGCHLKGLDTLISIRDLVGLGSFSTATALLRVLFETYLIHKWCVSDSTQDGVISMRTASIREAIKFFNDAKNRGPISEVLEPLARPDELPIDYFNPASNRPNIATLAEHFGIGHLYAALYRTASRVIHAHDIDETYNPLFRIHLERSSSDLDEPYFTCGISMVTANDFYSIMYYSEVPAICMFGQTADFFSLSLSGHDRDLIQAAVDVTSPEKAPYAKDFEDLKIAAPEIFGG